MTTSFTAEEALVEARRLAREQGARSADRIEMLLGIAEADPQQYRQARLARSMFYLGLGRYDDVLRIGAALRLSTDPSTAGLGANLEGVVHLERGDFSKAVDAYEAADSILPEDALGPRGNVWARTKLTFIRKASQTVQRANQTQA